MHEFFGGFLSVPHLADIYAKMWVRRVGTLCANAHYRATLFYINAYKAIFKIYFDISIFHVWISFIGILLEGIKRDISILRFDL